MRAFFGGGGDKQLQFTVQSRAVTMGMSALVTVKKKKKKNALTKKRTKKAKVFKDGSWKYESAGKWFVCNPDLGLCVSFKGAAQNQVIIITKLVKASLIL